MKQTISNTKNQNIEFFKWLFNTQEINLIEEKDIFPSTKKDEPISVIYYPNQLKNFFESMPMQRLKRILQLGPFIQNNSSALQTRYEHSIGVYNLKKELIINQFYNNSEAKEYIEKNNLKNHLIAELIKSAAHDIGHLPLSHALEISVLNKKGFHEEIGKRILLEHPCIKKSLSTISDNFGNILRETLENDIFGLKLLDEGNYDIDRFDYIKRDLAHNGQSFTQSFENFRLVKIQCENLGGKNFPLYNEDGSVTLARAKK